MRASNRGNSAHPSPVLHTSLQPRAASTLCRASSWMAHASRIAPLDRQHVLKADPLVASFSATYVSCVPCNSKIKLTTSYGLTKWRIHCQRVHGRSKYV